jgi:hypothetical protein
LIARRFASGVSSLIPPLGSLLMTTHFFKLISESSDSLPGGHLHRITA